MLGIHGINGQGLGDVFRGFGLRFRLRLGFGAGKEPPEEGGEPFVLQAGF